MAPRAQRVVVLVSPNYKQRKEFYGGRFVCAAPLPMVVHESAPPEEDHAHRAEGQQLYVAFMLDLLSSTSATSRSPTSRTFCKEVQSEMTGGAGGTAGAAPALLSSPVSEASKNKTLPFSPLADLAGAGTLVVCDLTDPMLAPEEANVIFEVLFDQYTALDLPCGKIVAFDEAHKYLGESSKTGLSAAIVDAVRTMRHKGMRVVVSTQSPLDLPSELLELVSVAVVHRFHSRDWYQHLCTKIPLPAQGEAFPTIQRLPTGSALVFAAPHGLDGYADAHGLLRIQVRPRLTSERGVSRANRAR